MPSFLESLSLFADHASDAPGVRISLRVPMLSCPKSSPAIANTSVSIRLNQSIRACLNRLLVCVRTCRRVRTALMLAEYKRLSEPAEKARILYQLGRIREHVLHWRAILVSAIDEDGRKPLRFAAGTEVGGTRRKQYTSRLIRPYSSTTEQETQSYWYNLERALGGLSREGRITLLMRCLHEQQWNPAQKWHTAVSLSFAKLLLESVYGSLASSAAAPTWHIVQSPFQEYKWIGNPRKESTPLSMLPADPDWLGALIRRPYSVATNHLHEREKWKRYEQNLCELFKPSLRSSRSPSDSGKRLTNFQTKEMP